MIKKFLFLICIAGIFSFLTAQTVYITKSGKKYHTESCSYLSKSKIAIDLKEAIEKGYSPCSKCKPDKKLSKTRINSDNKYLYDQKDNDIKKSKVIEQQCQAITKKGTQCKRKAVAGSIYCWQHKNYEK